MTRVRTDNVFGTVTDDPLTAGATTLNSAGLANLAAVSSAEAIIILDPNRVSGAPEIVVVTAHTGSATSATITRGQFGTSAREHAAGTEWVHGPIASNASSYATAADDQGDFVPMNAWETYVPVMTQGGTVTHTATYAKFIRIGRTIHFVVDLSVTGSGTGSNQILITLPVAAAASGYEIGPGHVFDSSATTLYGGLTNLFSTTQIRLRPTSTDGAVTGLGVNVFTAGLASGDLVRASGMYEAAS